MKSVLISDKVWNGDTNRFNTKMNTALSSIEAEGGFIRDKKYSCKSVKDADDYLWHNVLIFYEIIPTRKVLTEKAG